MNEDEAFAAACQRRGLDPEGEVPEAAEWAVSALGSAIEAITGPLGGDPAAVLWLGAALEAWGTIADASAGWAPPAVPALLTLAEVRDRYGWTAATTAQYRARGVLVEPDAVIGRTPVWLPATLDAWEQTRPGQGAGGGRPKK